MKVYIGQDKREEAAYRVAEKTLCANASVPLEITPLNSERLAESGLLRRPMDTRWQPYDLISNAHASTEFAVSRFLVPILCQSGWALFVDCDVVFLGDVAELFALADPKYAVQVVKHSQVAGPPIKMDGQIQAYYARKNWSSVVLWNCDHAANKRLSLADINGRPGRDLHRFYWLNDAEIGDLPASWNWLVNAEAKPEAPKLAHFTNGGPWLPTWDGAPNDDLWLKYA